MATSGSGEALHRPWQHCTVDLCRPISAPEQMLIGSMEHVWYSQNQITMHIPQLHSQLMLPRGQPFRCMKMLERSSTAREQYAVIQSK